MKKYIPLFCLFFSCFLAGFASYYFPSPIPKIIHYVWLGKGPMPDSVLQTLETWKKYAPEYKIMRWDETNCNPDANDFMRQSYRQKKYAWSSDYCRALALSQYGGIYLDTDHHLLANPDSLLRRKTLVLTYENNKSLSNSFIATIPHNPIIEKILEYYEHTYFYGQGGPSILTQELKKLIPSLPFDGKKYQTRELTIYPANILMFNFGGGENVANHLYVGSSTTLNPGHYYIIYKNTFLEQQAIKIKYNNKIDYFIPLDETHFYILSTKKRATLISQTPADITVQWASGIIETIEKNNL